jgi:ferredoxin
MPTVTITINDQQVSAQAGERLLDVARREQAHIGFVCDGNGFCQTCQCRVLAGNEHLSPPNEIEKNWLPQQRLDDGYRLACQAAVRGRGPIETITVAEELRRLLAAALNGSGTVRRDAVRDLTIYLTRINLDQLVFYPWNMFSTVLRLISSPPDLSAERLNALLRDAQAVTGRAWDERGNAATPPPIARTPARGSAEAVSAALRAAQRANRAARG